MPYAPFHRTSNEQLPWSKNFIFSKCGQGRLAPTNALKYLHLKKLSECHLCQSKQQNALREIKIGRKELEMKKKTLSNNKKRMNERVSV